MTTTTPLETTPATRTDSWSEHVAIGPQVVAGAGGVDAQTDEEVSR